MRTQTLGRKPQRFWKKIINTDTVTIKKGAPVVLNMATSSEKLGVGVISIDGLAAANQGFFFGLAVNDLAAGAEGDSVFGYFEYCRMIVRSRAASTDVWASTTAGAIGDVLALLTVSSVQAVSRSAAGSALTNAHKIILGESFASATTSASSITAGVAGTDLIYSTAYKKVFISIM